jgi:hypothetical protein
MIKLLKFNLEEREHFTEVVVHIPNLEIFNAYYDIAIILDAII